MNIGDRVFVMMDEMTFQKEFGVERDVYGKSGVIQQAQDVEGHKVFTVLMEDSLLIRGLFEEDLVKA